MRRAGGPCDQELTFTGGAFPTVGTLGIFDFPTWGYLTGAGSDDGRYAEFIYDLGTNAQAFSVPGAANGIRLCVVAGCGCGGSPRSEQMALPLWPHLHQPCVAGQV